MKLSRSRRRTNTKFMFELAGGAEILVLKTACTVAGTKGQKCIPVYPLVLFWGQNMSNVHREWEHTMDHDDWWFTRIYGSWTSCPRELPSTPPDLLTSSPLRDQSQQIAWAHRKVNCNGRTQLNNTDWLSLTLSIFRNSNPPRPANTFTNVKEFEFPKSKDTVWSGNTIGSACVDDSADFASGSIPQCD